MIDIKQAVQASVKFAESILGPERAQQMLVEEVEGSNIDGRQAWVITLSLPSNDLGPLASLTSLAREYKRFAVDKETGEVLSMRIRQLAKGHE